MNRKQRKNLLLALSILAGITIILVMIVLMEG